MGQIIDCRQTPKGLRYRLYDTSLDVYITQELTEEQLQNLMFYNLDSSMLLVITWSIMTCRHCMLPNAQGRVMNPFSRKRNNAELNAPWRKETKKDVARRAYRGDNDLVKYAKIVKKLRDIFATVLASQLR